MRRRSVATVLVGTSIILREGLTRILNCTGFRIVASVAHLGDVAWTLLSPHSSVLLILNTGGRPEDSIAQIRLFKEHRPSGRVAVLADQHCPGAAVSAFQAGANLYLGDLESREAFTKALELVMLGHTILPPELLSFIGERRGGQYSLAQTAGGSDGSQPLVDNEIDPISRLSARERCILHRIVEGDSNKLIARKIGIAEATVKVHVKAILRKIQLRNRTQAAIWAISNGARLGRTEASPSLQPAMHPSPPRAPGEQLQLPASASLADLDQAIVRKNSH